MPAGVTLNRPIDQLLTDAAFHVERLDNYYVKGPKAAGYMYEGVANKA